MGFIVVDNLTKTYTDRRRRPRHQATASPAPGECIAVLDHLDLEFEEGEMVCILGPSGCGKSTLLRIMAGFDPPTEGRVLINGEQVNGPRPDQIFVYQHCALLPWMTVWRNVGLGLRHLPDAAERRDRIQEHIEMVGLEGFEHYYPHELSGGMQRRAELARALAVNPEVLFMDEPFTGLDFINHLSAREEVVNIHRFLGKTIVFITHDIEDGLIMGDRLIILSGQPATVTLECRLDFPHPRDFDKNPALRELRSEIFFMLGVPYAV
jgi:ABC-type nitrate/sulfonate/bicarbonate transport system ATPase subunit